MVSPIVSLPARLLALGISVACLTMLSVGAYLTPSPDGTATHIALGFQPCAFLATTHLPCPTCGMTTATAHFVRGHFLASLYTQPAGFLIALIAATTFWSALYMALTGRPSHRMLRRLPTQKLLFSFLFFAIAAWGWKIFIQLSHIDGWRFSIR